MWVRDLQSGGTPIPERERESIIQRIEQYAQKHYRGRYQRLDVRFRGSFCYVDAFQDDDPQPVHLCRLRHFNKNLWSVAIYTYSNEAYTPSVVGADDGSTTIEAGFAAAANLYLT